MSVGVLVRAGGVDAVRRGPCLAARIGRLALRAGLALLAAGGVAHAASGQAVEFDPRLVFGGGEAARAVSRFERDSPPPAGRYHSEIFVNQQYLDTLDVLVRADGQPPHAEVCLDRTLVRRLDLDPGSLLPPARVWLSGKRPPDCLEAGAIAPGLQASFDLSRLRVDIAAPAAVLVHRPQGWVSPLSWSDGMAAGRLNYQFNAVRSRASPDSGSVTQLFLGLAGGVNAGAWQFRHDGTLAGVGGQGMHYTSLRSDLRHDVASLGGYVLVGQGQSKGQLLDSVPFQGVMLASDGRMLPASQRGYAPVIRGIAPSAATVRVMQNSTVLYQTTVPAGAFVINDLYPPASGAPLQVLVTQLDGRVTQFTVPYATLPQLQRPGHASYQLLAGRMGGAGSDDTLPALLGSVLYGLNNSVTAGAGMIAARGYTATALGTGFSTRWGALALDLTRARFDATALGLPPQRGQRLRGVWSVARGGGGLVVSATSQSVDYFGPLDVIDSTGSGLPLSPTSQPIVPSPFAGARTRSSLQVQLSQSLRADTSVYVSGSTTRYWNLAQRQTSFQLGYVRSLGRAQLSVLLSRQIGDYGFGGHNVLSVAVSLPLGPNPGAPTASLGVQRDSDTGMQAQWALSGNAGADSEFGYGVQAAAGSGSRSGGVNGSWRGSAGSVGAAYTRGGGTGSGSSSLSVAATGGMVAFPGGVTFTPYLGDTIALVRARGAEGAAVIGGNGSRIDSHGYGVATYLTPYAADTVGIDAPRAETMKQTSARVIPRAGAIVEVRLRARRGRWVLLSARLREGGALPFAAQVFDATHRLVGYVGQGSRIDAHLRQPEGRLLVRWGEAEDEACAIDYRLEPVRASDPPRPLWLHDLVCEPVAPAAR